MCRIVLCLFIFLFSQVTEANVPEQDCNCAVPEGAVGSGMNDVKQLADALKRSDLRPRESDCYSELSAEDRQVIQVLVSRVSLVCDGGANPAPAESCQQGGRQVWLDTLRDYKDRKGSAALDRVLMAINAALQERHIQDLNAEFSRPALAGPFNEFSHVLTEFHQALDRASYRETRVKADGKKDDSLWGRASRYTSMYLDRQGDYWLTQSPQSENRFTRLKNAQKSFSAAQKNLREHISQLDVPSAKRSHLLEEVDAAVRFTNSKITDANQEFEETRIGYLRTSGLSLLSLAAVGAAVPAMSTMVGAGVGAAGSSGLSGVLSGAVAAGAGTAGALGTRAVVNSTLGAQVDSENKKTRFFCELARRKAAMGADLVSDGWKHVATSMVVGTGVGGALAVLGKFSPNAVALAVGAIGITAVGKEVVDEVRRESAQADRQKDLEILAAKTSPGHEGQVIDARFASARAQVKDWSERAEAAANLAPLVIGGIHGLRQTPASAPPSLASPPERVDVVRSTLQVLARNKHDPLMILKGNKAAPRLNVRVSEVAGRLSQIEKTLNQIHPQRAKKVIEILRKAAVDPKYLKDLEKYLGNRFEAKKIINQMTQVVSRGEIANRSVRAEILKESAVRAQQTVMKHEIRVLPEQATAYPASVDEIKKSLGEIDELILNTGLEKPKDMYVFFVDDARRSVNATFANYVQVGHPQRERLRALRQGVVIDGREAADHEYGHAIFSHSMRRFQNGKYQKMDRFSDYSKLWGKAIDIHAAEFRNKLHANQLLENLNAEWLAKQSPTLKDRFQYWTKVAEIKLNRIRTTGAFANGKLTAAEENEVMLLYKLSSSYQEVYADIVSIAKRGEQKAIGETLSVFGSDPFGRSFGKRFKRAVKLNSKTPNQGEHHALDGMRNMIWNGYFVESRHKENYPKMLERLHRVMAEEIFTRAADPKLRKLTDAEVTRRLSGKLEKAFADFD